MSDDLNELRRRQELITAAQLPSDAELDREAADLRATWLEFGKLLEAARAGIEPPAQTLPSLSLSLSLSAGRRWRWPLVVIAALAGTVLLMVTVAAYVRWGGRSAVLRDSAPVVVKGQDVTPPSAISSGSRQAGDTVASVASKAKTEATASRETSSTWSDPLDQEIDRAGRAVVQVRGDSLASAAGSERFQNQLEKIRKSIDEGPF